jgi:hypothetical protein
MRVCRKLICRGSTGVVSSSLPERGSKRRFTLRVNASGKVWTPDAVVASGRTLDLVARVILQVTGSNDEEVAGLAGLWANSDVPVRITFARSRVRPTVSNFGISEVFNVPASKAYVEKEGIWGPTLRLRKSVVRTFAEDHLVTVGLT